MSANKNLFYNYFSMMTSLIKKSLLLSLIFVSACEKQPAKGIDSEHKKTNFVFILADDLGFHDLSFTGSEFYETPNLDRIAEQSIVFTQGYSASSVCSPSRASIMTGQNTARHGITDWIGAKTGEQWRTLNRNNKTLPPDFQHQLRQQDITIAEALLPHGYNTFFAGKWHLGSEGSLPENHGFKINKGGWRLGSPRGGYFSPWRNPYLDNQIDGENLSMRLANETADFINANQSEPFFAFLSFYAVHSPIQTTQTRWRKYRDKAHANGLEKHAFEMERVLPFRVTQDNPVYAGLVEQMDDSIGVVIDALESAGLSENTVIIFTSDNGGVVSGDVYATSNLPLRGGKGYQWEGGIRQPYFIQIPNTKAKNIDYPVSGIDFYPTLLDLAGVDIPDTHIIDGVSLLPLLQSQALPERPLFWHYPHYGNQGGEPTSIIRKGDWKLINYHESGKDELYNLMTDPAEKKDVANQFMETSKELKNELMAYLNSVNAKFPSPDNLFDTDLDITNHNENVSILLPELEQQRLDFLSDDYNPDNNWWSSEIKIE